MLSKSSGRSSVQIFGRTELSWPMGLLLVAAIPMIILVTARGAGDNSAWVMMTTPIANYPHAREISSINFDANSFYGYSGFWNDIPIQKENFNTLSHITMFSGGRIATDYYAVRPIYPFLASTLLPALGWKGSMIAINIAAWLIAPPTVFAFALRLTDNRRAAAWAALFSLAGMGFVVHIHDYSAHLLSFTLYFISVFLIYESRVWCERRPWQVHLALGSFLAIAALEYNTGLVAIAGYAIVGVRHNGLLRTACVVLASAIPAFLWAPFLNFLGGSGVDYGATERLYRRLAWQVWTSRGIGNGTITYAITISNFLSYENLIIVIFGCGGLGLFLYSRRNVDICIYVFAFFLMPILAVALYVGPFLAKGYLTYQTAIFLYVGVGFLIERSNMTRKSHVFTSVLGTLIWCSQLAWNLSYLLGVEAPTKIYFVWGYEYLTAWVQAIWRAPTVVSLTGIEPVPAMYGGSAGFGELGAAIWHTPLASLPGASAWSHALAIRVPLTILGCVCIVLLWRQILQPALFGRDLRSTKLFCFGVGVLGLGLVSSAAWNSAFIRSHVPVGCVDPGINVAATSVQVSVAVSANFLKLLKALPDDVRKIEVLDGFRYGRSSNPGEQARLAIGSFRVPLGRQYVTLIDRDEFVRALEKVPRIDIEADNPAGDMAIHGWQANGTRGRFVSVNGKLATATELPLVPEVEVRARAPGRLGLITLLGF